MSGYMSTKTKKKKKKIKPARKQLIVTGLVLSMFLGIVIGSVFMLIQNNDESRNLQIELRGYLQGFTDLQSTSPDAAADVFRESSLKYVKLVIIIWLLAFIPAGGFIAVGFIFLRGFGYGLTTTALIGSYGSGGVICVMLLYLPQALILMPAYIFVAYNCFNFILTYMNAKSDEQGIVNYFVPLLIGSACCLLAGAVDVFLVPLLIERFL